MKKTLRNKKGFTLAELLIVVAIIAVLVAIAIPIFTAQLEKARDAVSVANLRTAYAEAQTLVLTGNDGETSDRATLKIKTSGTDDYYSVAVTGVDLVGTKDSDNWSGLAAELPFTTQLGAETGKDGKNKTVTFNYNKDGVIKTVTIA